jgi:RNA polymerase sigma-70 factor (ECF subfamily)
LNGYLEKELAASCRNGDKSAYTGLVKAYSGRVFAICLGMLGNAADAEDVAQQTFMKGFTEIKHLRDGERFGAWISRISQNMCTDFIRRQRRRRDAMWGAVPRRAEPKEYPELEGALARLPQDYRLTLVLYYFDGRSTKKIAEALGISQGTVQARLSRARKKLRKLLKTEENM